MDAERNLAKRNGGDVRICPDQTKQKPQATPEDHCWIQKRDMPRPQRKERRKDPVGK